MVVCDICKQKRAHESFVIPLTQEFWASANGHKVMPFKKLEKTEVVICHQCQVEIARIFDTIIKEWDDEP